MFDLAKSVCEALREQGRIVAVSICSSAGSAPRTAGAHMLVGPDGRAIGTVGGGNCEWLAVRSAREMLLSGESAGRVHSYSLAGTTDMDMICGGSLTLIFEPLQADAATLELFDGAAGAEAGGIPHAMILRIQGYDPKAAESRVRLQRFLIPLDPGGCGESPPLPAGLAPGVAAALSEAAWGKIRFFELDGAYYFAETGGICHTLHLFGGGHVSLALARLADFVGFRHTVADDRPEFASRERFPQAQRLEVTDMEKALAGRSLGLRDAVIILTRGHAHDREVLAQALRTRAGYIGMIGSRGKRAKVYGVLRQEGFTEEDLGRVHSPIGLDIRAETPEEIAVSIMAELIAWKNA